MRKEKNPGVLLLDLRGQQVPHVHERAAFHAVAEGGRRHGLPRLLFFVFIRSERACMCLRLLFNG